MNESIRITIVEGPDPKHVFELTSKQTLLVGRGDASDTKIDDAALSRAHFRLSIVDGEVWAIDAGSRSGIFVNGDQKSASVVQIGDKIRAGNTVLQIGGSLPDRQPVERLVNIGDLIGQHVGGYMLEEVIATGRNGIVFKAKEQEKDQVAAVKVLLPRVAKDEEQRERFVRAMKTMLNIKDTHIVELYSAGRKGPFCWAAMEYIEGESLASLIDRLGMDGILPWEEVWRAAVHVTRALQVGYRHHIIHRNLTPTNIIRRQQDKVCKLGDFTFAKALEGTLAFDVTSPGQIIGDLQYLPPERLTDAEVDTRGDMYGLGATCYALLTGRPPVNGKSVIDITTSIRSEVPKPPKEYQLYMPDLFQDIVLKLLKKDPNRRYNTPDELLRELEVVGQASKLETDFSGWWQG